MISSRPISKRLARSREARWAKEVSLGSRGLSKLEVVGILAQIFLAMVAIFGYFYTVRPVYQKEQLAEQVAEYDSIIRKQTPKIKEIEAQLVALREERSTLTSELQKEREQLRAELQRDRARMTAELKSLERELMAARNAKQKIESQVEFMAYRYRTPDGSPAVTREQVRSAQESDLRRNLLSAISASCSYGASSNVFPRYRFIARDAKNASWPFTDVEISLWREHGAKYPIKRATDCIESAVARYASNQSLASFAGDIESIRKEALLFAERTAAARPWVPPVQPADVQQALASRLSEIQGEQLEELKSVEEKYKGWEYSVGDRRVLLKHNYETEKRNAETNAMGKRWKIEGEAREKSDALSKAIDEEVRRLLISERRNG